jgi:hypothetical protein
MASLWHSFGQDLQLSASGSLLLNEGASLGYQTISRRMLTNAGDHPWFLDYGAGLPGFIGTPAPVDRIRGAILKNARNEPVIDQRKPVNVTVTKDPGSGVTLAKLSYTDADTRAGQVISLPAGGR